MSTPIRTRYLPSPTGPFHVGGARTALFNYLYAKKHGGKFILRIEDTDLKRSKPEYEKDILESLSWLGIEWDEGPTLANSYETRSHKEKGGFGPYRQSERAQLPESSYKKYLQKLLKEGKAFYCFHSGKELKEERDTLLNAKKLPIHICEYRSLTLAEQETLKDTTSEYIIRFKTPLEQTISFKDEIRGELSFASDLIGDFSIARKDFWPLYNFAVVADDEEMKITHVIRGEDHIPNTPKQILLIEALGFRVPIYAHIPLILGQDRSKMSKRHGDTSVNEYRAQGYLPEAIFNFIALLGWNPGAGDNREILSKEELIREFSLAHVQKSGAIFDVQKLDWMNGEYIRAKSVAELARLCKPYLEEFLASSVSPQHSNILENVGMSDALIRDDYFEKIVMLEQPRLKKLSEIGERAEYFFRKPEYDRELLRWKNMADEELTKSLTFSKDIIESRITNHESRLEVEKTFFDAIGKSDKGKILWPLRVALTGKKASPGPFEIIEIMGIKKAGEYLDSALKKFG